MEPSPRIKDKAKAQGRCQRPPKEAYGEALSEGDLMEAKATTP